MNIFLTLVTAITTCTGMSGTLVAAHRGGLEGVYPENTLPAFRHALEGGADLIELDLRATADGAIVVHHDRGTARTTGRPGLVHRMTLPDIRALNPGGSATVPTLQEVIDWALPHPIDLLLDVKPAPGLRHGTIVEQIVQAGLSPRVLLGVRSLEDVVEFRRHAERLRFLGFVPNVGAIDAFLSVGVEAIRLWPGWLESNPDLVEAVRRGGASVWVTAGAADARALMCAQDGRTYR